jgi:hypothetical protein
MLYVSHILFFYCYRADSIIIILFMDKDLIQLSEISIIRTTLVTN